MRKERVSNPVRSAQYVEDFIPILKLAGVVRIALSLRRASDSSTILPSRLA
jgi:hypothetical protein